MSAFKDFIRLLVSSHNTTLITFLGADKAEFYEKFVGTLFQQLMEKIDKVRETAGRSLQYFFKYVAPQVGDFAEKDRLYILFIAEDDQKEVDEQTSNEFYASEAGDDEIGYLPWRSAEFVFQQIMPFFDSSTYSLSILKGLITSSGGLTESTLKASSNSLFEYLSAMGKNKDGEKGIQDKKDFLEKLITIYQQNLKDERVTIPLMKTIEMLLSSDYLSDASLSKELERIHALTVSECQKTKNISKLISSSGVFVGLLAINCVEL